MNIVLITIIAGLLGATGRLIFLELVSRTKLVHYDMIKVVGTLYQGSFEHALLRGFGAHYFFGLLSAFIYLVLISFIHPASILASAAFGGLIGLFNGWALSFSMVALVAEHHPKVEFRTYGHEAVIFHWIAQVLYGSIVGATLGAGNASLF